VLDIMVVAIVIIFVILGYRKGLVLSAMRFITWLLSFVMARIFSPVAADYFFNTQYFTSLNTFVKEKLVGIEQAGMQNFANSLGSAKAGESNGVIGDLLIEGLKNGDIIDSSNVLNYLSLALSSMIVRIGCLIIVFVVVSILFAVLMKLVKGVVRLPVIKQLDKSGGVILGVLEGLIISYVIILIVSMFKIGGIEGDFQDTILIKYFLNIDILKSAYLIVSQ
jgi:uncharacterized membrane protein required for colicin V production